METYRQPLRIRSDENVTMVGMVSDLTGIVRSYYQNWSRPLAEKREDLQSAKKLGRTIVGLAAQRPWREDALQDVLRSLCIQDRQMHDLVSNILTDARVDHQIAAQKGLHSELQIALHEGTRGDIRQVSTDLYRLTKQILTFLDRDPVHSVVFSRRLKEVRREDPVMHRRIVFTLNEVALFRPEVVRREIPQPRPHTGEIDVYRNNQGSTKLSYS